MSLSSARSKEPGIGPKNEKAPLDGRAYKRVQKTRLNGRVLERRFAAFTATHAAIKAGLFRAEKVFRSVCEIAPNLTTRLHSI